ncbi:hypothetical protein ES703_31921 [subsurface metagenome]
MVHRSGVARAIMEGRVLEILSAHIKGGLTIHQLAAKFNSSKLIGSAGTWLKLGLTSKEAMAVVVRLFNRGLVKRKPNGKRAGVWFLNGGCGIIPMVRDPLTGREVRDLTGRGPHIYGSTCIG